MVAEETSLNKPLAFKRLHILWDEVGPNILGITVDGQPYMYYQAPDDMRAMWHPFNMEISSIPVDPGQYNRFIEGDEDGSEDDD
jgi:hypothetical protein